MATVRIQLRRDTATNWTSANPVLAAGEIGLETDTDQFKVGDGTTAWSSLPYGGIQGPAGADGVDGVVAATAPITYDALTSTVGIDQTGISITASQLSDVTATAAELNILDGVTATATELNYVDGVTSNVQTQLDAKAAIVNTSKVESGSTYTLAVGDINKPVVTNPSGPMTITVPANTFPDGTRVDVITNTDDVVTFASDGTLSLRSKDSLVTISGRYKGATIVFHSQTVAYLIGDLA